MTTLLCSASATSITYCCRTRNITMGPACIYPWRKMHRSRAPSIAPGTFFAAQPWADCITNMPGFNLRQAQPNSLSPNSRGRGDDVIAYRRVSKAVCPIDYLPPNSNGPLSPCPIRHVINRSRTCVTGAGRHRPCCGSSRHGMGSTPQSHGAQRAPLRRPRPPSLKSKFCCRTDIRTCERCAQSAGPACSW